MTYPELLRAIYASYGKLLLEWDAAMERAENIGVFAFTPEGYSSATTFDKVMYNYWAIDHLRAYLKTGGETDEGLADLLTDFGFGEEFLVMIVEHVAGPKKHAVHIHKITKVGLN